MIKNKNTNKIAVKLVNVSKQYEIHHEKPTLVEKFTNHKNEKFMALTDINLTIKQGERIGFMGPNGCGKTTLLKIITGITAPTKGRIETHGKIVSLIDLEAGFHPDLTGIQNIYINGMILGMSKNEINEKLTQIIEFADIHQFIDAPLFTYSQGMKLRLGFSVAIHANPQILILDEFMGLGDANFQQKSLNAMKKMLESDMTIITVSHWLEYMKKNTKRIYYLDKGRIVSNIKLKEND